MPDAITASPRSFPLYSNTTDRHEAGQAVPEPTSAISILDLCSSVRFIDTGYRRSLCQSFSTPQKTFILIYAPYVVAMHASAIVTIFCLDIVFAPSLAAPSTQ
jgi:hypothetical protein